MALSHCVNGLPILLLLLLLAVARGGCAAFSVATAVAEAATQEEEVNARCRIGLYMHDSNNPVLSAFCPPKIDCRALLGEDVPAREIRCTILYLGSPRLIPNQDIPDDTKNLFRFGCSSRASCAADGGASGRLCYRAADALAAWTSPHMSIASTSDAAVLCA